MAEKKWKGIRVPTPLHSRLAGHVRHGRPIHKIIELALDALEERLRPIEPPRRAADDAGAAPER